MPKGLLSSLPPINQRAMQPAVADEEAQEDKSEFFNAHNEPTLSKLEPAPPSTTLPPIARRNPRFSTQPQRQPNPPSELPPIGRGGGVNPRSAAFARAEQSILAPSPPSGSAPSGRPQRQLSGESNSQDVVSSERITAGSRNESMRTDSTVDHSQSSLKFASVSQKLSLKDKTEIALRSAFSRAHNWFREIAGKPPEHKDITQEQFSLDLSAMIRKKEVDHNLAGAVGEYLDNYSPEIAEYFSSSAGIMDGLRAHIAYAVLSEKTDSSSIEHYVGNWQRECLAPLLKTSTISFDDINKRLESKRTERDLSSIPGLKNKIYTKIAEAFKDQAEELLNAGHYKEAAEKFNDAVKAMEKIGETDKASNEQKQQQIRELFYSAGDSLEKHITAHPGDAEEVELRIKAANMFAQSCASDKPNDIENFSRIHKKIERCLENVPHLIARFPEQLSERMANVGQIYLDMAITSSRLKLHGIALDYYTKSLSQQQNAKSSHLGTRLKKYEERHYKRISQYYMGNSNSITPNGLLKNSQALVDAEKHMVEALAILEEMKLSISGMPTKEEKKSMAESYRKAYESCISAIKELEPLLRSSAAEVNASKELLHKLYKDAMTYYIKGINIDFAAFIGKENPSYSGKGAITIFEKATSFYHSNKTYDREIEARLKHADNEYDENFPLSFKDNLTKVIKAYELLLQSFDSSSGGTDAEQLQKCENKAKAYKDLADLQRFMHISYPNDSTYATSDNYITTYKKASEDFERLAETANLTPSDRLKYKIEAYRCYRKAFGGTAQDHRLQQRHGLSIDTLNEKYSQLQRYLEKYKYDSMQTINSAETLEEKVSVATEYAGSLRKISDVLKNDGDVFSNSGMSDKSKTLKGNDKKIDGQIDRPHLPVFVDTVKAMHADALNKMHLCRIEQQLALCDDNPPYLSELGEQLAAGRFLLGHVYVDLSHSANKCKTTNKLSQDQQIKLRAWTTYFAEVKSVKEHLESISNSDVEHDQEKITALKELLNQHNSDAIDSMFALLNSSEQKKLEGWITHFREENKKDIIRTLDLKEWIETSSDQPDVSDVDNSMPELQLLSKEQIYQKFRDKLIPLTLRDPRLLNLIESRYREKFNRLSDEVALMSDRATEFANFIIGNYHDEEEFAGVAKADFDLFCKEYEQVKVFLDPAFITKFENLRNAYTNSNDRT